MRSNKIMPDPFSSVNASDLSNGQADPPPEVRPRKTLPPGYSDLNTWIPIPDDFRGEPADALGPGWEDWTWERVAKLRQVILYAQGGRIPQNEVERWIWKVARRAARAEARRLMRRELAEL